jgi:N-methylhydantoinase A
VFSGARVPTKVYDRDRLRAGDTFEGPAMVVEYSATTVILPGCVARVDRYENLVIEVPC